MCRCYFCYTRGGSGSKVLMCLYDLEKAYDSVEYPVLHVGDCLRWVLMINGKLWRVMKNWYSGRSCMFSEGRWEVGTGVKQGSILSPVCNGPTVQEASRF